MDINAAKIKFWKFQINLYILATIIPNPKNTNSPVKAAVVKKGVHSKDVDMKALKGEIWMKEVVCDLK